MQVSHKARVWVALWTVYIVWGSTYLGIELAGETIPGVFGAGVRFTIVGFVMFGVVLLRRGRHALRIGRAELASAALVGLLLPGANSILFITEQKVPIGLTSPRAWRTTCRHRPGSPASPQSPVSVPSARSCP